MEAVGVIIPNFFSEKLTVLINYTLAIEFFFQIICNLCFF